MSKLFVHIFMHSSHFRQHDYWKTITISIYFSRHRQFRKNTILRSNGMEKIRSSRKCSLSVRFMSREIRSLYNMELKSCLIYFHQIALMSIDPFAKYNRRNYDFFRYILSSSAKRLLFLQNNLLHMNHHSKALLQRDPNEHIVSESYITHK